MSTSIIQVTRPVSRTPAQNSETVSKPLKLIESSTMTAECLRSVMDYDPETGIFTWKVSPTKSVKAGDVAGSLGNKGYTRITVQSCRHLAHRLAWLYVYGTWPRDQLDHINRDRLDNRISNLREVTSKQNNQNRSKSSNNTSGHLGVCWHKRAGKWESYIVHNQKKTYLGLFDDLEAAITARKAAEKLYWADTQ